ncbi:MAG: peptidoglycan-binding protein [Acidobacteriales bacterium]|nr:peptidoglycan-binding protein [Terriglobales bacterium]
MVGRLFTTALLLCVFALGTGLAFASSITPPKSEKKQVSSRVRYKKFGKRKGSWKSRGQQAIDKQRAREIQEALIREKYLQGEPNGVWDARSKQAMQKFQAAHGWQTRSVPDSRALIELGLGPKHENIINPETAMTPAAVMTPVSSRSAQQ